MATIWRTRDYLGRVVALTEENLRHIRERRPRMVDRLDEVKLTIEQSEFVRRDVAIASREVFYARSTVGRARMRVIVPYRPVPPQGTWRGEVITAHPNQRPRLTEDPLWP